MNYLIDLEFKIKFEIFCRTLYGEGGGGVKGVRSFWRGNGIAVFKMTPEMALRQGIFETFRELRGDFDEIVR
jgi:hypothetical protein